MGANSWLSAHNNSCDAHEAKFTVLWAKTMPIPWLMLFNAGSIDTSNDFGHDLIDERLACLERFSRRTTSLRYLLSFIPNYFPTMLEFGKFLSQFERSHFRVTTYELWAADNGDDIDFNANLLKALTAIDSMDGHTPRVELPSVFDWSQPVRDGDYWNLHHKKLLFGWSAKTVPTAPWTIDLPAR